MTNMPVSTPGTLGGNSASSFNGMQSALGLPFQPQQVMTDPMTLNTAGVSLALQNMLGLQRRNNCQGASNFLVAGATLDLKLKTRIWDREYIDLGLLAPRAELNPGPQVDFAYGRNSVSQLCLTPSKPRLPKNVNEWLKWFVIYASVYTAKFPEEAPEIFTYISKIFQFYVRSPHTYTWRVYDELFRQLRQLAHDEKWHLTNDELLRQAEDICVKSFASNARTQEKPQYKDSRNDKNVREGGKKPTGFCYDFNSAKGCTRKGCIYAHICANCKASHPNTQCSKNKDAHVAKNK